MKRLTIGILAHVDAGKTTLSESLLFLSGTIRNQGRVDHGDTVLDNNELERKRGITIFSKQAQIDCGDVIFTLIDTPGHVDFSAEMERTLDILDAAVLVVSSTDGIQGHTRTLAGLLKNKHIPTFVFVNKTDMPGLTPETIMSSLSSVLSGNPVRFDRRDEGFEEAVAMSEEKTLDDYLAGISITDDIIRKLIKHCRLIPVYFGSALKNKGVKELLTGLCAYCPEGKRYKSFAATVYKIGRDDKGNRLTFIKLSGGSLSVKDSITKGEITEKVEQIRLYSGGSFKNVNDCEPGGVYALLGPSETYAGEGLGEAPDSQAETIVPIFTYKVIGDGQADDKVILANLKLLEEEDPSLHVNFQDKLGEIHISLMGDVYLEVIKSIYRERFGHEISFENAGIVYKETITDTVIGVGHYEPLRHYGEVHLLMQPGKSGSGIVFDSDLSVDVMPEHYQKQIMNALAGKVHVGTIMGAPITDIHITLVAGRAHEKHTEGGDLREAAWRAVRQGLMKAHSVLLEPVYSFEMNIPSGTVGRAMTDIIRMNGQVDENIPEGEMTVLRGTAPAALIHDYQREIISYSSGRGTISLKLSGYGKCRVEALPTDISYDPEADLDNSPNSVFCSHGAGFVVPWDMVDGYSHVKAFAYSRLYMDHAEPAAEEASGSHKKSSGSDDLEEIFRRTYGESKRDKYKYNEPKVIEAPANPSLKDYKPRDHRDNRPELIIVDGYNLIHADKELSELNRINQDSARDRLLDILDNYQGYRGILMMVVFDAYNIKGAKPSEKYGGLKIVFSPSGQTADMYIETFVHENQNKYKMTVVTSDGLLQIHILSQGAIRKSSQEMLAEIDNVRKEIRGRVGN